MRHIPSTASLILLLAVLYFMAGRLGLLLAIPPGYATIFWPASGIALGFVYHYGYRVLPGVWFGSSTLNFLTYLHPTPEGELASLLLNAILIGGGATAQAGLGVWLIRRYVEVNSKLERPKKITKFIVLGGPVSGFVSASFGLGTLLATSTIPPDNGFFSWWTWYMGDVLGIIVFGPITTLLLHPEVHRQRKLQASLPLLSIFAVVVTLFYASQNWQNNHLRGEFARESLLIQKNLEGQFRSYAGILSGLGDFYRASEQVTREEFDEFLSHALKDNSGIRGILWLPRVMQSERNAFEKRAISEGMVGFSLRELSEDGQLIPARPREEYFPLFYAAPSSPERNALLGLDIGHEPHRRKAMDEAARKGGMIATERIRFFTETEENQYGFLLILPVYEKNNPHALRGFIAGAYRFHDVIEPIIEPWRDRGISILLHDASGNILYNSASNSAAIPVDSKSAAFRHRLSFPFFGQQWEIELTQSHEYVLAHTNWAIWIILAGGVIFTALFGTFLLMLTGRAAEIELTVSERTEELRKTQVEAEEANQAKSDFLANMSHEIRTPMTGIIGMARLLCSMNLRGQERHYVETITYSADALLQILDDILDFSKIEAGKLTLEHIPFNLQKLCKEVVELFVIRAWEKGMEFRLVYDANCPKHIIGDPGRIRQILFNLCSNAVKFTHQGHVALIVSVIKMTKNHVLLEITVRDTGIGIPPDKQELIFQIFDQLDSSISRKYGGTGLGLAITRKLLQMMGSNIQLKSEPGKGSIFSFQLDMPLAKDMPDRPKTENGKKLFFKDISALLVEDNLINQEVIGAYLRKRGLKVTTVANGKEALTKLQQDTFDIIFMDYQMPVMDGLETTRHLRKLHGVADVPVIAVTARALQGDRERCFAAGMTDYISKPIVETELDTVLKRWLPESALHVLHDSSKADFVGQTQAEIQLDEAVLQKLRSSTGDRFMTIIGMYLDEAEDALKMIRNAITKQDANAIQFVAHSFKTSSGQIGAFSMQNHLAKMEQQAEENRLEGMDVLYQQILRDFELVKALLAKVTR